MKFLFLLSPLLTNFAYSIVDLEMNDEPLVIDVDELVRQRLPRYYRFIPRWLTRWLERIIHLLGKVALIVKQYLILYVAHF